MPTATPSATEQQFASVFNAPIPFIIACFVVAGLMWLAMNWAFRSALDRQKSTIDGLKEERDRLKTKLEDGVFTSRPAPQAPPPKPAPEESTAVKRAASVPVVADDGNSSVKRLMASAFGKTEIKAHDVVRDALGRPTTTTGRVLQVSDVMGKVLISISLDDNDRKSAFLVFDDDHDRLRRLNVDEIITVTGKLKKVSAFEVQLIDCRLI